MMSLSDLLARNRAWAAEMTGRDPEFFTRLARQQAPDYLWIGCSDSRVPANQIIGLPPGELFVHRNIGNVVVHTDLNSLSVIQFAVDVLGVAHVIVCGHRGCSGVRAALDDAHHGLADNWLRHIQDVARLHEAELSGLSGEARVDRVCELNVAVQARNVARTTIVQDAWRRGQPLAVHAWIYGLEDGLIRDLGVTLSSPADLRASPASPAPR